jgi:hypothetical protein
MNYVQTILEANKARFTIKQYQALMTIANTMNLKITASHICHPLGKGLRLSLQ